MTAKLISRRALVGTAAVGAAVLSTARAIGLEAAMAEDNEARLVPGTYSSTAIGYGGDYTVNVTVSEDSIVKIDVGSHNESPQFGALALAELPNRVVRYQSVEVDGFSGATLTSTSFMGAVRECLEAAGGAAPFEREIVRDIIQDTLDAQVVVVGSGIGGLAAGLAAAEAGAKVIMLDKLSIPGGAATASNGAILAAGTSMQSEEEGNADWHTLAEMLMRFSEGHANPEVIDFVAANSAGIVEWYINHGVQFEVALTRGSSITYTHRPIDGLGNQSGRFFFEHCMPAFFDNGGALLVDARAKHVVLDEGGRVCAVQVSSADRDIEIKCDAVVLACGGYEHDPELMARWAPHLTMDAVGTACNVQDTGDGILMGLEVGGVFVGSGYGAAITEYEPRPVIRVTESGQRYSDESHTEMDEGRGTQLKAMFDSGSTWVFALYGANTTDDDALKELESCVKRGTVYTADTLEEVAEAAGVDAVGLAATVKRWNGFVETGVDEDFGNADVEAIGKYEEGPFSLVAYTQSINGTVGGLKIDLDSRVLNAEGDPIEGLYAAGETCNGEYVWRVYPPSGASMLWGSVTGKFGGEHAAVLAASHK